MHSLTFRAVSPLLACWLVLLLFLLFLLLLLLHVDQVLLVLGMVGFRLLTDVSMMWMLRLLLLLWYLADAMLAMRGAHRSFTVLAAAVVVTGCGLMVLGWWS